MRALLILGLCLLTASCAGIEMKQGSKSMARREIAPGPGLLTGRQGEFVILRVEDAAETGTPDGSPTEPGEAGEGSQ